jgi:hypothetical protein
LVSEMDPRFQKLFHVDGYGHAFLLVLARSRMISIPRFFPSLQIAASPRRGTGVYPKV